MAELIPAVEGLPGARSLAMASLLSLRHLPGDAGTVPALRRCGFDGLAPAGRFSGKDPFLVWRSPGEQLVVALQDPAAAGIRGELAHGRTPLAAVFALEEATLLVEFHGPALDAWLARLVDVAAIPREPGRAARCRLADVPVLLMRHAPERLWLLAERPLAAYLEDWLRHTHAALAAAR
jgi:sarcosine oxidase gamma subunit